MRLESFSPQSWTREPQAILVQSVLLACGTKFIKYSFEAFSCFFSISYFTRLLPKMQLVHHQNCSDRSWVFTQAWLYKFLGTSLMMAIYGLKLNQFYRNRMVGRLFQSVVGERGFWRFLHCLIHAGAGTQHSLLDENGKSNNIFYIVRVFLCGFFLYFYFWAERAACTALRVLIIQEVKKYSKVSKIDLLCRQIL